MLRKLAVAFEQRFVVFHRWLYIATSGRLGHHLTVFVPSLLLITTGRRSGERRRVVLSYEPDGDAFLVVGSGFGRPKAPSWLVNLQADPRAEVLAGPRRVEVGARIVGPDDAEFDELWRRATRRQQKRYQRYAAVNAGNRPIYVVRLERETGVRPPEAGRPAGGS